MSWVIAVGGQKGGTGKSTVAQGLAVEAVRHGTLAILADMDIGRQSSFQWAERRRVAGIQPMIDVRLLHKVSGIAPLRRLCDLLVIDTPGHAGNETLSLAKASDLLLLTTDTNALELEPTVMLIHSLTAAGIPDERLAIALTKVLDEKLEAEARAYLEAAGYEALPVALQFSRAAHNIANQGLAVTEAAEKSVAEPANLFFEGIAAAMSQARERMKEAQVTRESDRSQERGERER
ncbi:MAG: ParA family protein [Rhodomicrobium sp.]